MMTRPPLVSAAHELVNAVRTSDPEPQTAARAQELIEAAIALLGSSRHGGPYACEQLRPPGKGFYFDRSDPCGSVPYAPLTGPLNPTGGSASLSVDGSTVSGRVTFSPVHAGPMGLVHGGVLAGLFDEVMATAALAHGIAAFTRQLTITYIAPGRLGQALTIEAGIASDDGRIIVVEAAINDGGRLVASASGNFRKIADLTTGFYATGQ